MKEKFVLDEHHSKSKEAKKKKERERERERTIKHGIVQYIYSAI